MRAAQARAVQASWLQRRLSAKSADRLLATGLLVWALFDVPWWWRPPGHSSSTLVILAMLGLAVIQSAPLLRRRQQPVAVLVLAGASLALKSAAGLNIWSASAAVLAAAYGLGAYGSRLVRTVARVLAGASLLAAIGTLPLDHVSHGPAEACALLAAALGLGEIASAHRDVATAAVRHAHDVELAGIARELHDMVAHQLSAISVQAGAARLASARDSQAAPAAVAAIELEARRGLAELNHLVRALRPGSAGDPEHADRSPEHRLGDVPGLIERARESGVRADLVTTGQPRPLPAAVELAAYRVIQESLTNAIRYASGSSARVRISYLDKGIAIEVTDDGPGAPEPVGAKTGSGLGLIGLTERTRLLGGQLEAGGGSPHGFVVRAFLPGGP